MSELAKVQEIVERWRFVDTASESVTLSVQGSRWPGTTLIALSGARDDVAYLSNQFYVLTSQVADLKRKITDLEGSAQ